MFMQKFMQKEGNREQSRNLATLRETLPPKPISLELSVAVSAERVEAHT